jgi:RHS repeat-associated protein
LIEIQTREITLNLRLPGQYEDSESGTYYNYLRSYNPATGRYLESDPIGLKGGLNTYAYVEGSPLNTIDPLGLYWTTVDGVRQWIPDGEQSLANMANSAVAVPDPVCPEPAPSGPVSLPGKIPGWQDLTAGNDPSFTPEPEPGGWLRFGRGLVSIVSLPLILTGDTPQAPRYRWIDGDYEYEFLEGPQTIVVREKPGVIDIPMLRDELARFIVVTFLGNTYFENEQHETVGVIDPGTGAVSDPYISPEGIPFPSEENYRIARQEYEDYLANGGTLSFQEWLTQGRPEPEVRSSNREITFTQRQLQHAFRHAGDFGITGNWNRANGQAFQNAIQSHIDNEDTEVIQGTYRGNPVTHFYNPNTGLNVIRTENNNFLSGWRLSVQQRHHISTTGSLGGG